MEITEGRTNMVDILVDRGMSKYRIAKQLGVSWQTVNNWQRGLFKPSQTYAVKLAEMVMQP